MTTNNSPTAENTTQKFLPRPFHGRRRWRLGLLVANGFGQAAATIIFAHLIRIAFVRLLDQPGGSTDSVPPPIGVIAGILLGLACSAGATAWLRTAERATAEGLGQDYTHQVRLALFDHIAASSAWQLRRRNTGAAMLRFVGDLTALRQWVGLGLSRLAVAGTFASGTLIALVVLSPPIGAGVTGVVAAGVAAMFFQGTRLRTAAKDARRFRSRLAANVHEKVASTAVMQVFGQVGRERRRLETQSRRLRAAMVQRSRMAGRVSGITELTAASAIAAVVAIGGLTGQGADVVAAATSVVGFLIRPLHDLGRVQEYWQNMVVAREKITAVLARPATLRDRPHAVALPPGSGQLTFADITVHGVLNQVNATAEPGQVVAVTGANGAGKSTLLALAGRLLDPDRGQVLLDGHDLANGTLDSIRSAVGMVAPDLPLLRGSVSWNLRYGHPDAPEQHIEQIRRLCGVDELLDSLPDGSQTRLGDGGTGLSTGQRQRLALARALLRNPRLLLLDEADAHLDHQAAEVIDRVLDHFAGTVLIVTHRPERLAAVDTVWHLDNGQLRRSGSRAPSPSRSPGGCTARRRREP